MAQTPRENAASVERPVAVELVFEGTDDDPGLAVAAERPVCRKRRRNREGNEERGQRRDDDDDRKLDEIPPDLTLQEGDRQENDHVDHGDDEPGHADLLWAL